MLTFLKKRGFEVVRIRGSHHVVQKDDLRTVIPVHGNDTLKIGTLHGILRDAGLSAEEFAEEWES